MHFEGLAGALVVMVAGFGFVAPHRTQLRYISMTDAETLDEQVVPSIGYNLRSCFGLEPKLIKKKFCRYSESK